MVAIKEAMKSVTGTIIQICENMETDIDEGKWDECFARAYDRVINEVENKGDD